MADNADEFVFDPSLIESSDTGESKMQDEKLNLLEDKLFKSDELEPEKPKADEEEGKSDKTPSPKDIKDTKSSSVFSVVLGHNLVERGVLTSFDDKEIEKIATEQGEDVALAHIIESQVRQSEEQIKATYDEAYRDYLSMLQGGVSKEEALGIQQVEQFKNAISGLDLKSDDDNATQARKDLLTFHYRLTTKWNDDKIEKYVNKLYDEGSDLAEVDDAYSNLENYVKEEKQAAIDKAAQAKSNEIKARQQLEDSYKKYINDTEEYFKGDKVSKAAKEKMEKLLLSPVKLENGTITNQIWAKRSQNPVAFDAKIAFLETIGYFDNKPLDRFVKTATTKATTELSNFLSENKGNLMKSMGRSFTEGESDKKDFLDF